MPEPRDHLCVSWEVGIQPRPEPDEAVRLTDGQFVPDLGRADDATGDEPGDLDGHDVDALRGTDPDAVALVVRAGLVALGGAEPAGPVLDGDDLAADRGTLNVRVEHRKEDADPRHRFG